MQPSDNTAESELIHVSVSHGGPSDMTLLHPSGKEVFCLKLCQWLTGHVIGIYLPLAMVPD